MMSKSASFSLNSMNATGSTYINNDACEKEVKKTRRQNPFRNKRNYQVSQQCVFLALLNQYFDIKVKSPPKCSTVAQQFIRIDKLYQTVDGKSENELEIENFINARCRRLYELDLEKGITKKTANRRSETNRITETVHYLMDLLREFDYFFNVTIIDGKKGTLRVENVVDTRFHPLCSTYIVMNKESILSCGQAINNAICTVVGCTKNSIVFNRGALSNFIYHL